MNDQWLRKLVLIVYPELSTKGLDLSAFRVKFAVQNADSDSPDNAYIRVYNLADNTISLITKEFNRVVLNAGYVESNNFGTIFQGTIKQFKIGKETPTEKYLDILAADGDIGFNQGIVNASLAKGQTPVQALDLLVGSMPQTGIDETAVSYINTVANFTNIRGQVLWGLSRARLHNIASTFDWTWSIQNGKVVLIPRTGYLGTTAVKINKDTGQIGMPEQTDEGIKVKCLLNSKIRIGGVGGVKCHGDKQADSPRSKQCAYTL